MNPKTDDFRLEQDRDSTLVTFTPTGASFRVSRTGSEGGGLAIEQVSPPRDGGTTYEQEEVQAMACRLVADALAAKGSG